MASNTQSKKAGNKLQMMGMGINRGIVSDLQAKILLSMVSSLALTIGVSCTTVPAQAANGSASKHQSGRTTAKAGSHRYSGKKAQPESTLRSGTTSSADKKAAASDGSSAISSASITNSRSASEVIKQPIVKQEDIQGDTIIFFADGTRQVRYSSATVITEYPNGKTVIDHAGGTKMTEDVDGTITIDYPDGMRDRRLPDGRFATAYSDGTAITRHVDGRRSIVYSDGRLVTRYVDGRRQTLNKDGSKVTFFPDGRVVVERQDGSKHEAQLALPEPGSDNPVTAQH